MIIQMSYKQQHTDIKQIIAKPTDYVGKIVTICGWIKTFRAGKKNSLGFCKLNDGTCVEQLQILFDKSLLAENHKTYFDQIFEKATTGVSLKVIGPIVPSPKAEQPVELQAHSYEILGDVKDPETYPIAKTELGLDFLRTVPHLRVRTDTFASVNRIKSVMKLAFAEYFDQLGFHEVQVPLITDNECESGANPFTVTTVLGDGKVSGLPVKADDKNAIDFHADFFRKRTYLTVSGQLHLETLALALQKVWTMTTAFRAEPSTTRVHAAEFWMLELEFCFCTLEDNMKVNEGAIKYCIKKVLEKCRSELVFLQNKFDPTLIQRLEKYASVPFIVTTHEKCIKQMLQDEADGKVKFEKSPKFDDDIGKEHEKYITDVMFGGMPVFVCFFPFECKAFYMPIVNENEPIKRVSGFDLLMPNGAGEVVGGSQRETDYNKLIEKMEIKGINPKSLEFYSDLRKYGTVPHGGSGIGFDRLVMLMTSLDNIRDTSPFARTYEMCYF